MKSFFCGLILGAFFFHHISSQCILEQFQTCLKYPSSSSPSQCATLSGCEPSIDDFFGNINAMKSPSVFKYTASPNVQLTSMEVSLDTLNHRQFREHVAHFPLSRPFTITRTAEAGGHNVSLMMPTLFRESSLCSTNHVALASVADHVLGSHPGALVDNCQTMLLTSVCLCFVSMKTESGSFVMTSKSRHPLLSDDPYDNDLRRMRRLEGAGEKVAADLVELAEVVKIGGKDDIDVDYITHTALVILTVVAFIGNALFLTCVFCVSAV